MKNKIVKKVEKPVRILIYSSVAILLIGVALLFIFSDNISQYVSDKAKEKVIRHCYYEETRARREEKERIEDEKQKENGTGKYAQEIEFKYDNNKTGKVVFILTGKNRGIEVRFQDGKILKTYCSWMRLDAFKTIKLDGNDYEDLYFRGVSGGSGGYSVIYNMLNTNKCEIISYSTTCFNNETGKWTEYVYKSENFTIEEFKSERKYLETILGPYIPKSKSSEVDSKPGIIGKTILYPNFGATPKEIIYYSGGKEVARKIFLDVNDCNTKLTGKIPDGAVRVYWDNGIVWLDENYIEGKLSGLRKEYYYNGILAEEENYKDGKQDGYYKRYAYRSGNLFEEGKRKDGKYDGLQTSYYEDGKVEHETYFDFEKYSIAFSKYYHKNGKIKSIETYKNNRKINLKIYDELGRETLNQDFPFKEETVTSERKK